MPIKVRSGGSWVQVTDSAGNSTITDVNVVYTGRTSPCSLPITVTGANTKTINIPDSSNAFGAKYVQNTEPTGNAVCNGDIWYDTSGSASVANESSQTIEATICFQNPTSLNQTTTFPLSGTRNGGVFGPYTISSGVTLTISSGSTFTIL